MVSCRRRLLGRGQYLNNLQHLNLFPPITRSAAGNTEENYEKAHEYLNKPANSLAEEINSKRNVLTHSYLASLNLLDEDSSLFLLEENLDDFSKTLSENASVFDAPISEFLAQVRPDSSRIQSGLNKSNVSKILKPLPCSDNNGSVCSKSENFSDSDFQQFLSTLSTENGDSNGKTNFKAKSLGGRYLYKRASSESLYPFEKVAKEAPKYVPSFKSAREDLIAQDPKTYGNLRNGGGQKRSLGLTYNSNATRKKFVSPLLSNSDIEEDSLKKSQEVVDERLKNIDPKMVELIKSEIMDCGPGTDWDDIAGLEFAKSAIKEAVVWPMLRPDIFTGLRRPPKGILLFGPPGTGKTLIGKCVASQSKSTFFSISASSLTSKWIGDSEKMVRALFAVARVHQPSVIFIDEIDSLLCQRSETEHESSRRLKTEFLVQLDGATTESEERILLIGATNRPQELDEAARRRFVKRLYIPLPEFEARLQLVRKLMSSERHSLSDQNFETVARQSDGYSGADMRSLCSEASLGPIRSIDMSKMQTIEAGEVRPISMEDFTKAFTRVRSSVAAKDLGQYIVWDDTYGSGLGF